VRRALVVIRDGPAGERGWLALRTALSLGLGGYAVSVWLTGGAVVLALAGADVGAWSGGDPGADLDGLIGDMGAGAYVDSDALDNAGGQVRHGVVAAGRAELERLYRAAQLVVVP
jgi:hypothetical protein